MQKSQKSAKKLVAVLSIAIVFYLILIVPFSAYMRTKPIEEKLGYIPSIKLIRPLSSDHKELIGASLVMKALMYFGGLVEKQNMNVITSPPDYQGMSRLLHGAVKLDPYNMDAYYFAQSFLVWDAKQYKVANELLEYGMKYRSWDWYLPFFAGFNYAYFLKDFPSAAKFYKVAGELSGQDLLINLAGRYMQESGQTAHAIGYLKAMIATSRNETARKSFQIRLKAFEGVRTIERARDEFVKKLGRLPGNIDQLVASGHLSSVPSDPYGGRFFLEPDGRVNTTSKFAFAAEK